MRKSYKFRLYPKRSQLPKLEQTLLLCCDLYNSALSERQLHYHNRKRLNTKAQIISKETQSRQIKEITKDNEDYRAVYSQVLHDTINRVDLAFKAFFSRAKAKKDAAGYPRYKSKYRY